jgi:hypothetical protein
MTIPEIRYANRNKIRVTSYVYLPQSWLENSVFDLSSTVKHRFENDRTNDFTLK